MIPADIRALCEKRPGTTYLADASAQKACLDDLEIDPESEFYALFSELVMENMFSSHSPENLRGVADSAGELDPAIPFAWEVWELPKRYLAITSLEGEGGYFYDKETGAIVDFELAHRKSFLSGEAPVLGRTAFDFMRWYLSDDVNPRGYAAS